MTRNELPAVALVERARQAVGLEGPQEGLGMAIRTQRLDGGIEERTPDARALRGWIDVDRAQLVALDQGEPGEATVLVEDVDPPPARDQLGEPRRLLLGVRHPIRLDDVGERVAPAARLDRGDGRGVVDRG